ncbi:MAG: two-component regulator propeller domain-containing protein [Marinoscillum sp.]
MSCLFCCASGYAQENFRFRHLSTQDGLSQGSVISIAQDQNGLLWFATRDGLNTYDGNRFTVFRNDPKDSTTISNNDILEVLVADNGDLWIGTYNGLNKYCYSENRFHRFFNDKNDPNSLANNSVWALCQMDNGEIWIGTGGGINIYKDGKLRRLQNSPAESNSLTGNYAVEIFQDSKGVIWVGTSKGLNRLVSNGGTYEFEQFVHDPEDPHSLSDNFVQAIAEDKNGALWFGTRGGLQKYDPSSQKFTRYVHQELANSISHSDVRSLTFDQEGNLWIGTYNGLNKMSKEGQFTRIINDPNDAQSLSKNTIKSTFIDRKGTLWVGVYYGGINMLDETNGNFTNYQEVPAGDGLSYDVVSTIVEDASGQIYVGTEGGGINFLNPKTGKIDFVKAQNSKLSSNNIKALYLDADRDLWIGTLNTGIDIYDTFTGQFIGHYNKTNGLTHNSVYGILKENDSLFWVGTFAGGLHLLNIETNKSRVFTHDSNNPVSISDNQVRLLRKDVNGNLWIGTQYGLNLLSASNIQNQNFEFERFFYDEQKKSGEDILVTYEDSKKRIWVGTYESGLSQYDSTKNAFVSYEIFDAQNGASNVVHGILEDAENNLWVSSNHGITRVDPITGTTLTFDQSDGLVSNEFNNNACFKSKSGKMYFGGPQGLTSFYPQEIRTNKYAPNTIITDLKVFNQTVKVGAEDGILSKSIIETEQITLDHDQAIFSLEFAIPSFINPDKNQYQYRLAGLEENWNITQKNTATYTIQRPGTYTFEVRGANNDGIWSNDLTNLKIVVRPAPWRTWWAFLIYFLIILVSLYLLTNIMLSRSKLRHQLELEHLENERQQSIHQMKLRFFTNISHEFRTPLTLILGPLEQILQDYKGSNKVYKQLQVMEKNSVRLLKLVNQLLDFRKFENKHEKLQTAEGNIVRFVEEIYLSFRQYAKIHHIEYQLIKHQDQITVWYDRDKMERVFYNLISNAFKYTSEGGSIRVEIGQREQQLVCSISDTGIGLDPEHLDRIFDRFYEVETEANPKHQHQKGTGIGLAIAKGVVDLHSGDISVSSEKGSGTVFTISLPLGKDHLTADQIIQNFKDSEDLTTYQKINNLDLEQYESDESSSDVNTVVDKSLPCILVVEDNQSVRKFIVDVFKGEYRVEEAENGMQGFKKAIQLVPDLIISDVMMPKMDGIEFCYQAKSNLKTSHIPFILLTARTSLIFKFEGLESGADEYINKPFNVKELKLKTRNLINTFYKMREKFSNVSIVKPAEITVSSIDEKLLKRALEIVEENISNEFFNIQLFSSELGVSRTMLFTKVKAWTNLTPNDFIHSMRMKRAAQILEQNKVTVSEVSYQVGFTNPKYFSKCFQKYHGSTPTEYAGKFTIVESD